MSKKLYIIDGYSIFFRAFYAVKELKINNVHLNAIYGSIKILTSLINKFDPKYLVVAMDSGRRTFRDDLFFNFLEKKNLQDVIGQLDSKDIDLELKNKIINSEISLSDLQHRLSIDDQKLNYFLNQNNINNSYFALLILYLNLQDSLIFKAIQSGYKANRKPIPDEMKGQFEIFEDLLGALKIQFLKYNNYEADDIVASYAVQHYDNFDEIIIISSDKDLKQLINEKVKIYDPVKKIIINETICENTMQIRPSQIIDYLAIIGDRADNIPGIFGIGPKNAIELLHKYNNIENIILNLDNISNLSIQAKIRNNLDILKISYDLVKLADDLKIDKSTEHLRFSFNHNNLVRFNEKYNFFKSSGLNKTENTHQEIASVNLFTNL